MAIHDELGVREPASTSAITTAIPPPSSLAGSLHANTQHGGESQSKPQAEKHGEARGQEQHPVKFRKHDQCRSDRHWSHVLIWHEIAFAAEMPKRIRLLCQHVHRRVTVDEIA